jgi:hypothetical protein
MFFNASGCMVGINPTHDFEVENFSECAIASVLQPQGPTSALYDDGVFHIF